MDKEGKSGPWANDSTQLGKLKLVHFAFCACDTANTISASEIGEFAAFAEFSYSTIQCMEFLWVSDKTSNNLMTSSYCDGLCFLMFHRPNNELISQENNWQII